MGILRRLQSDFAYFGKLGEAGWNGIASTRQPLDPSKRAVWTPAVIGVGLGILSGQIIGHRRRTSGLAVGGLLGGVLGLGTGVAWCSRSFLRSAAHNAGRLINDARDARWLERNPIDYA